MTTDNIARADEIVGLTASSGWAQMARGGYAEDIRRTRYLKWLDENAADAARFSFRDDIARLAAAVVTAHAAKRPQPRDGLPPGPFCICPPFQGVGWVVRNKHGERVSQHDCGQVKCAEYVVRALSPAVRSILAACDDAELERWAGIIGHWKLTREIQPFLDPRK